jgi:hypothetical protein
MYKKWLKGWKRWDEVAKQIEVPTTRNRHSKANGLMRKLLFLPGRSVMAVPQAGSYFWQEQAQQ